jgi:two-component system, LytTR family, response regulator LytT
MNILIIEDEKKTAALLRDIIEKHEDKLVVNVCEGIDDSVAYLLKNQLKLDLIFMDIQLSDGLSFEIFNRLKITIPVVFCTAYDDYMLTAFKNNGIYYILKPFREKDIELAFEKITQLKTTFSNPDTPLDLENFFVKEPVLQTCFLVRYREKMLPIQVRDIAFIFFVDETVFLYNFSGEKFIIAKTMEQLENAISPRQFYRVNRQMIINRKIIKDIEPYFNRKVVVHLTIPFSDKVIVSRLKVSPFLEWIESPL